MADAAPARGRGFGRGGGKEGGRGGSRGRGKLYYHPVYTEKSQ